MRLLLLFLTLFFWGCSPRYKVLVATVLPEDPAQRACIQKCTDERAACMDICRANFSICRQKADDVAQKRYEEAMKRYTAKLEQYTKDLEEARWEQSFYYDGCFGYGFGCTPYESWYWGTAYPYPYLTLSKPKKPNLEAIRNRTEMQMCRIDCGCENRYLDCFKKCGGRVIRTKKCVANCPAK